MRINAYREIYLSKAQSLLAESFDYAINICKIPGEDFIKMFCISSVSKRIENGESTYITGKSGADLVADIMEQVSDGHIDYTSIESYSRSEQYWTGWVTAYYQWHSGRSFSEIFEVLSYEDLLRMYYTLHEADISKFIEIADEKMKAHFADTNLKRFRSRYGCSQSELSELSGVGLRSIQLYEQRQKDINKASAETLYNISKVLGCSIEDLLE